MDMRCSVDLRPSSEKQAYIESMLVEILTYFCVGDGDKGRFLAEPKIREIEKMLRSSTMPLEDIVDYLGENFNQEWQSRRKPKHELENGMGSGGDGSE